jgi:quinol monooxygenase YgiN
LLAGFMILRVWRCKLKSGAGEKLRRFAEETAMPMLRRQDGCLYAVAGVSENGGEACVVTVWRDLETLKGFVVERWWEPCIHRREAPLLAERPSVSHYKADASFNAI